MFTKKQANEVSEALINNQTYALNSKAKPVNRFYRFEELKFFEPYKRKAIVAEAHAFAIRQPSCIYTTLTALIAIVLTGYFFESSDTTINFIYFLSVPTMLGMYSIHFLKRKLMLVYIKSKIESIVIASSNEKN